ncbi:MAG: hypothetical protein ACLQAT_18830 [Candidatus Binataceae bacterium]
MDFARHSVVPPHIEGRQNVDREKWQLSRYLLALKDRLPLPVTAIMALPGESPDFVLEFATEAVGLEVTEATTTEFHNQLEYSERHGSYPDENDLDQEKPFVDLGWIGDSPETTNAALVMASIRDKARSIAKGTWRGADHQDLLIYCENAPGPGVRNRDLIARVRPQLLEAMNREPELRAFRRISLIAGGKLIFDIAGECAQLSIPFV